MLKRNIMLMAGAGVVLVLIVLSQTPAIKSRLAWRYEVAKTYTRNVLHPVGSVPTAIPEHTSPNRYSQLPRLQSHRRSHPLLRCFPPPRLPWRRLRHRPAWLPLPTKSRLPNNCGPAALSMMLHIFGWSGDQKTISDVIKPVNGDRNVNPEELAYWVRNYAGWLRMEYRVGGDLETLKRLIAAGYPGHHRRHHIPQPG